MTGTKKALEGVQENGAKRVPDALVPAHSPTPAPEPAAVPVPAVAVLRTSPLPAPPILDPSAVRPVFPLRTLSPWFLSPAVFLLAAGATFLLLFFRTGSVTASTPQIGPLFDPRSASLDMRVQTDAPGLLLSWNRYSPAVQGAKSAVLAIQDGREHHEIALDRNQIVNGSVFYRPASDDVSFRLDIRDTHGADVAQILRVLDSSARKPASGAAENPKDSRADMSATPPAPRTLSHAETPGKPVPAPQKLPSVSQVASAGTAASAPPVALPTPSSADPVTSLLQSTEIPQPPTSIGSVNSQPVQSTPTLAPAQPKDLPAAAYVPPRPLKWVQPGIQLTQPLDIKVKVRIDETGHVIAAHALIEGPKRDRKLMAAAAAAVRQWTFEPAKAHGANVPCEETIVIHLGPEAP